MQVIDIVYLGVFGVMVFSSVMWLLLYTLNRETVQNDPEPSVFPEVTFLVPAYNEEENIEQCLNALLDQNYPENKLKIIAINDGSEDNTLEKLKKFKDRIQIIDKENTGKAASMNLALEKVETEIVGCMDADSFPHRDMVKSMVGYFEDSDVKGVTPAMKVKNPKNWVQEIMWAEYIYQIFLRKLFSMFDAQYVLPGPGSLYDTDFLREVGGWDENTLTEDMEVAFRIFVEGGVIRNSTNAYVETISPPTLRGLFRQRIRWYRGYIDNATSYKGVLFNPKYGNLGVFMMPFNIVWLVILMFMISHLFYRIADMGIQFVQTYLMLGFIQPSLHLTIQKLSMFHFFYALFFIVGVGTLFLSLKTASEDLQLWKRKKHYFLFLWVYAALFSLFWIAAIVKEIQGDYQW